MSFDFVNCKLSVVLYRFSAVLNTDHRHLLDIDRISEDTAECEKLKAKNNTSA